jgi:uncharacterized protein
LTWIKKYGFPRILPGMIVKALLVVLGTVFLVIGVIGIFMPLLPGTPFLLLASACYLRSSERLHRWLLNQGRLGAHIRAFEQGKGVPLRAKVLAMVTMWPSIAFSAWIVPWPALGALFVLVAVAVSVWLWRMPTARVG